MPSSKASTRAPPREYASAGWTRASAKRVASVLVTARRSPEKTSRPCCSRTSAWRLRYVVAALHLGLGDRERARSVLHDVAKGEPAARAHETAELRAWLEASVAGAERAATGAPP